MPVMDTTYTMQSKQVIQHSQAIDATQIIESVHVNKANVCVVHGT